MTDYLVKPDLDELAHFGVKGMKWGHHKTPELAPHTSISRYQHQANREQFGKRGARSINEKLHAGKDLKTAREETRSELKSRRRKQAYTALAIYTAIRLAPAVMGSANAKMSKIADSKKAKNGAKIAQELFADTRGIGQTSTHVIESVFNSASGLWE